MDNVEKRALSISISSILYEKLQAYCLAHDLCEEAIIERAISEWLEREESLERCFWEWEEGQDRSSRLQ